MDIHGHPLISNIHGSPWISMDIHGYPWVAMHIHRCPWTYMYMDIHGYPCMSMDVHGYPWIFEVLHEISGRHFWDISGWYFFRFVYSGGQANSILTARALRCLVEERQFRLYMHISLLSDSLKWRSHVFTVVTRRVTRVRDSDNSQRSPSDPIDDSSMVAHRSTDLMYFSPICRYVDLRSVL